MTSKERVLLMYPDSWINHHSSYIDLLTDRTFTPRILWWIDVLGYEDLKICEAELWKRGWEVIQMQLLYKFER
jgi:hypothetical protein